MTEDEYIIKGAELADGWTVHADGTVTCAFIQGEYWLNKLKPPIIDALAAQLVRQAQQSGCNVAVSNEVTQIKRVIDTYNTHIHEPVARAQGFDRTMNTIRAIVDSGVFKFIEERQE